MVLDFSIAYMDYIVGVCCCTLSSIEPWERFKADIWAAQVEEAVNKFLDYLTWQFSKRKHGTKFKTLSYNIMRSVLEMKDKYEDQDKEGKDL